MIEQDYRKEIVSICKSMYNKNYISSTDGNVSVRLKHNRILVTPSGINKGFIKEADIIIVDIDGNLLSGTKKPTSEIRMHLACYKERSDVNAVIHAHPPLCVAFSLAEVSLAQCILPEVILSLGSVPTTDYATPTTEEVPLVIKEHIKNFDAIILDRHGSLTLGNDLIAAFNNLERIEHAAQITFFARQLGNVKFLPKEEVNKLISLGQKLGVRQARLTCQECGGCGRNKGEASLTKHMIKNIPDENSLVKLITEKVLREIK